MNRHCYRVLFNRARGLFVVCQENARSAGGSPSPAASAVRFAAVSFIAAACALLCVDLAHGQIIADPSASGRQRPTVLSAPNGVPVVNIQTPSAAGVSHNTYRQFDVNSPGAILNNSRGNVQTQLGGWVQGNPWLAQGSARVILNEVNSSNPSLLRGAVEVAGPRAEVIIANPSGITVNGGSFINTSRVTLTTGSPVMNGGNLESYRVQRGNVLFEGRGLDAGATDYTAILARAVQVNAGIWAKALKVVAGAHEASADGSVATPIAGTGPAPTYLLDVAALGGMYAGHIFLVGTEAGLGVRNAGSIASTGTLSLTADGRLINSGSLQAASDIGIDARGVDNSGSILASHTLRISTPGDIVNTGGRLEAASLQLASTAGDIDNVLPATPGQPLQLRDVEQGIENLKRPPSADADIQIVPVEQGSAGVAQSDLAIHYRQPRPLRLSLSADNGGTKATGKHQGSATVFWDNPLALNDLLSFSAGHNLERGDSHGTRSALLNYAVPWDYWLFGATASHNHYHQSVPGASQTYVYSGASDSAELRAQRVVWRSASARTSLGARVYRRTSATYIDDVEVEVQHRVTSVLELSATHRHYLGDATVEASLAIRHGTGAFGAQPAPEENAGEGTSRLRMTVFDLAYLKPFKLFDEKVQLSSTWHGQWNQTPLTPIDRIAIGSRYSVRGFDGESSLLGDRGWFWRNDLAWSMAAGHEAYVGLDAGQVGGPSTALLAGSGLAGGVVGLRGGTPTWRYDFFVGRPIHKPASFQTARTTVGFNLSCTF